MCCVIVMLWSGPGAAAVSNLLSPFPVSANGSSGNLCWPMVQKIKKKTLNVCILHFYAILFNLIEILDLFHTY